VSLSNATTGVLPITSIMELAIPCPILVFMSLRLLFRPFYFPLNNRLNFGIHDLWLVTDQR
jgi:hypothetical protein